MKREPPVPSGVKSMNPLLPYTAIVGTALLATYSFANFLLEPSTGARYIPPEDRSVAIAQQREQTRMERKRGEQDVLRNKETDPSARALEIAAQDASPNSPDASTLSNPMRVAPVALS